MNGTWLGFITLLIVVLIAVTVGAQQMQDQQAQEINQLMEQRDTTVNIALDAKGQRDDAYKARDEAVAKVDGLSSQVASLEEKLSNSQSVADARQKEIDRLNSETSDLKKQMENLQAQNVSLREQVANIPQVPLTAGSGKESEAGNSNDTASANNNTICLPVRAENLPTQLGLGLAVLIGMAALGSGGYIYYRHDPSRKYTVKMTKEQIREYARYQRERGNGPA